MDMPIILFFNDKHLRQQVTKLEEREHARDMDVVEVKTNLAAFQKHVDHRFTELGKQFELRFEQVDRRFEQVDKRFEQVDKRFEKLESKMDNLQSSVNELTVFVKSHLLPNKKSQE